MADPAHALDHELLSPWTYFHSTGSREQLMVSLDRLRARGWTISSEPPIPGAFGSWDVLVRAPSAPLDETLRRRSPHHRQQAPAAVSDQEQPATPAPVLAGHTGG